jgi:surface antigen
VTLRAATRCTLYRATLSGRIRRGSRVAAGVATARAVGLSIGGCSYELGSLLGKDGEKVRGLRAGSPVIAGNGSLPSDADLAFASAAAADVLTKGSKDAAAPWENPSTGARGMITPIATEYDQDGSTCREFLASYVKRDNEAWLQGEACRQQRGKWVVRSLRPWQRGKDSKSSGLIGSVTDAS